MAYSKQRQYFRLNSEENAIYILSNGFSNNIQLKSYRFDLDKDLLMMIMIHAKLYTIAKPYLHS